MFRRIILSSLHHQRARLSIAALAMALGSALVSGLLNLSGDIGGQVGRELRAYGANIVIRPREQSIRVGSGDLDFGAITVEQTLSEADLTRVSLVEGVITYVPSLYAIVEVERRPVVLGGIGLNEARALNTWWQVQGRWPETDDELLVGVRAVEAMGLVLGDPVNVKYGDETRTMRVVGVLETGGPEDEQLITGLRAAQTLTAQPGQVGLVLVSALATERSLAAISSDLQTVLPQAEVRTLAQFAQAEATVLSKVRLLIGLVAALVLIAGALTVGGTLNIIVMERRTEIGLMKALGADDRRVAGLFLVEALNIGGIGGIVGYLAGLALAVAIGQRVFEATIAPTAWGPPGTLLIALGVALLASLLPVRHALAVDPVKTLRGE